MENSFLFWEVHVIRRQMARMSVEDIASLLGHPFQQMAGKVRELTGGLPTEFELRGIKVKNRRLNKSNASKEEKKPVQMARKIKVVEKVFKTRNPMSQDMISVRIDKKTVIMVKPGTDIEAIREKYRERDPTFLKPENPSIKVSNFKPVKKGK